MSRRWPEKEDRGGLYIHIPYCRKKCLYCDFFSGGLAIADWDSLVRSLLNELRERMSELPRRAVSIYFGGGTPSAMPPDKFTSLLGEIRSAIGPSLDDDAEITVEVNPEDVTDESVVAWYGSGVNRVSLGVESLNDRLLRSIGRRHSAADAIHAFETLRSRFGNISADLIFGLPGQSKDEWEEDIRRLIQLGPEHISAYSLMYEPGTALTLLRDENRIEPLGDDLVLEMFGILSRELKRSGYGRYEISNYSRPGFESRHNSLYWKGNPYLGLGPSAHSYDSVSIRRANPADLKGYLRRFSGVAGDRKLPFYTEERLTEEELREEFILTRLRLREGFSLMAFRERFGDTRYRELTKRIDVLSERGEVEVVDGRLSLTETGIMVSDSVFVELAT